MRDDNGNDPNNQTPPQPEQPAPATPEKGDIEQKEVQAEQPAAHEHSSHEEQQTGTSGRQSGKYYSFDPLFRFRELNGSGNPLYSLSCRYGSMTASGLFYTTVKEIVRGDSVIVKTELGMEIGEALTVPVLLEGRNDTSGPWLGEVVRSAEREDLARWKFIKEELEPGEFDRCVELIESHKLPMKLVDVEHLFGGDRIIFYFLSENRVDFRALVRDLSKEFRTRIEMRQIGVRDEAKLLASYEHCGRPLCCKSFMSKMEPVSMRMAKQQKTTLDPAKISGRCGRLMCCLRFEDEVYGWLKDKLPRKGQIVHTKTNRGQVIDVALIRESVLVIDDSDNRFWVHSSEIVKVEERPNNPNQGQGGSSTPRDQSRDQNNHNGNSNGNNKPSKPEKE